MRYETIDPVILRWSAEHGVHVSTAYKDEEVRSIQLVGRGDAKCQIWIDVPDSSGSVEVHVWDYKKRRRDFHTDVQALKKVLEEAHATALDWCNS